MRGTPLCSAQTALPRPCLTTVVGACSPCLRAQGRNSVYNTDVSTVQIVGSYAQRFEHVMADFMAGVS